MADTGAQELGALAKTVLALGAALIVAGVSWRGVTYAELQRFWGDLAARPTGPMKFRFALQPIMAIVAAVPDALIDARNRRTPYFLALFRSPGERSARLREGLNATARIILLGLIMDLIYQVVVLSTFYPVEALFTALVLAFAPYVVVRGLIHRALRRRASRLLP